MIDLRDSDAFRQMASACLHVNPPGETSRSDNDLNAHAPEDFRPGLSPIPAAVLVPVVMRPSGLTVLLTQRTADLPSHAGQIAFPGGKVDADDDGALAAALREAEEEIGLSRAFVEPLGFLDAYRTVTGFAVAPAVALVREGFELTLNAREVADAFEVPLAFLLDPANHQRQSREWKGARRYFYAMPYEGRFIWGATAGMIRNLYERLAAP